MTKVSRLTEAPKVVNQGLVDLLEHLTEQARKGDIRGVSLVKVWDDGSTGHAFAVDGSYDCIRMIGDHYTLMTNLANYSNERLNSLTEIE